MFQIYYTFVNPIILDRTTRGIGGLSDMRYKI